MTGQHSALFQTYVRNLQRIYWVEFIETQTELMNAQSAAAANGGAVSDSFTDRDCLTATYDYFRYR